MYINIHVKFQLFWSDLLKLESSLQSLEK